MLARARDERSVKWRLPRNEGADRAGWSAGYERPYDLLYQGHELVYSVPYKGQYQATFPPFPTSPKWTRVFYPTLFEAQVAVEQFFVKNPKALEES